MKITLFELLERIYKGKDIPDKIKIYNMTFKYERPTNDYINENGAYLIPALFDEFLDIRNALKEELEIVEDSEKTITKEQFLRYVKIQKGGKYNMLTEWVDACREADLTEEQYFKIIKNYSDLKEKYKND